MRIYFGIARLAEYGLPPFIFGLFSPLRDVLLQEGQFVGPSRPYFNQNPIPLHSLPTTNWHSPQINTHLDCYPLQNVSLTRNILEGTIALSISAFIYCFFFLQGSEHCNGLWISTSLIKNQNSNTNLFQLTGTVACPLLCCWVL